MAYGEGTAFVAHVLCELADVGNPSLPGHPEEGHLTVHHEPGSDTLFVVWDLSHFWDGAMDPIWPVLEVLAREMEPTAVGVGAIGGLLSGEGYESMRIEKGTLIRNPEGDIPELDRLWERFWALLPKEEYPEAATKAQERVDLPAKASGRHGRATSSGATKSAGQRRSRLRPRPIRYVWSTMSTAGTGRSSPATSGRPDRTSLSPELIH
jgi:hypothetical protein